MTTEDRKTIHSFVDEFGIYMVEYLQRVMAAKTGEPMSVTDIRNSVGYALEKREACGASETFPLGVVREIDGEVELDEEMIAESRRLAAMGKIRPMQDFIDERRSHGKR